MLPLIEALRHAGVPFQEHGKGVGRNHVNIHCPWHSPRDADYMLGIHSTDLWYRCWFCHRKGQWGTLARELARLYPHGDFALDRNSTVAHYIDEARRLPPELVKLREPLDPRRSAHAACIRYLTKKRRLKLEDVSRYRPGVGIGKLAGYVTFEEGPHLNGRLISGHSGKPRYNRQGPPHEPCIFGAQVAKEEGHDWVALVEGMFDVFALPPGRAVACLGNIANDDALGVLGEALEHTATVMIALDATGVHENNLHKLKLHLTDMGYEIVMLDWPTIYRDMAHTFEWTDDPLPKDLDELRVQCGSDFVLDCLLGQLHEATAEVPLL